MNNSFDSRGENQIQSLLDTVERLRRDRFQSLDAELVRDILRLHADSAAGDGELARGVEQAVERYLSKGI
jgi:hypothetical protein